MVVFSINHYGCGPGGHSNVHSDTRNHSTIKVPADEACEHHPGPVKVLVAEGVKLKDPLLLFVAENVDA